MSFAPPPDYSAILLVDKPKGWTSHDCVAVVRGALKTKTGHSGTLDPMATGLLILLLGRATKLQDSYQKLPKTYFAEVTLGAATDTWDADGSVVATAPVPQFNLDDVRAACAQLTGRITHPVPFYSAKKVGGKAMYKAARSGQNIAKTSEVDVFEWRNLAIAPDGKITFEVNCGSGTYVRSLAVMLAQKLGTVGHISALRRLAAGGHNVIDTTDIEKLKKMPREDIFKCAKTL